MVMEELATYRQELVAALMRVVEQLSPLATAIPSQAWHVPSDPLSSRPHFILAHLRALEEQEYIPNLKLIQAQDIPFLAAFDDQSWMAMNYKLEEPVKIILDELTRLRAAEVEWLGKLTIPDWRRMGRHPWWGLRSLQWWVERQLETSLQHSEQLKAFLTQ